MSDRPSAADRFRGAATKRALGLATPISDASTSQGMVTPAPVGGVSSTTAPREQVVDPVTADLFGSASATTNSTPTVASEAVVTTARPRRAPRKAPESAARRVRVPVYVPGVIHTRLAERTARTGETYTAVVFDAVAAHQDVLRTRYAAARGTGLFVGTGRRRRTGKATTQIQLLLLPQDKETLDRLVAESQAENPSVYVSDALELYLA